MKRMPRARRAVWMLVVLSLSSMASADEDDQKAACMAAHRDAQVLRNQSHLGAARAELARCAASACPQLVANDCTQWLAEVEQQQPSIVIAASDGAGHALVDASAFIDGKRVATNLDGTPTDVDPGEHELAVRTADGRSATQRVLARQSEKARLVRIQLPGGSGPVTLAPPPRGRTIPTASWVLGGVAVAAAIPSAIFGVLGWSKKASLDETCKGTCELGSIEDVHRDFNLADVAGGVALAALGASLLVALLAPSHGRALSTAFLPGGAMTILTQSF